MVPFFTTWPDAVFKVRRGNRDGVSAGGPSKLSSTIAPEGRTTRSTSGFLPRKEVIQPQLPLRLPCYDFTPITSPTFDGSLPEGWVTGFGCCPLSWCDGRCVQGPGTYSPRRC